MSDTTSIVMRRLGGEEDMLRCVVREIVRLRNRNSAAAVSCICCLFFFGGVGMGVLQSLTCYSKILLWIHCEDDPKIEYLNHGR